jgi:hypothetical protein
MAFSISVGYFPVSQTGGPTEPPSGFLYERESRDRRCNSLPPLRYLARNPTEEGLRRQMDHKELRIVLMDHFRRFLAFRRLK